MRRRDYHVPLSFRERKTLTCLSNISFKSSDLYVTGYTQVTGCWRKDSRRLDEYPGPSWRLLSRRRESSLRQPVIYMLSQTHSFFALIFHACRSLPDRADTNAMYRPTANQPGTDPRPQNNHANPLFDEPAEMREEGYTHTLRKKARWAPSHAPCEDAAVQMQIYKKMHEY